MLLEDAHLQPVGLTSKMSFRKKKEFENANIFLDETGALYRFVSTPWYHCYDLPEVFTCSLYQ